MEAAVASAILRIVCNKLAPLLKKKYSLFVRAKKDLKELHGHVMEINNWLESVGDKAVRNDTSFNWLKELKDIAYDVDDIVDEFQLKAEHDNGGESGIMSKYLSRKPKSIISQRKVATKIKAIKKKFAAIVEQRNNFSTITNSLPVGHPVRPMNMTVGEMPLLPNIDAASVIGRDKEKHELISKIVEVKDQQIINIVSIVGLGGSGKTTLAKLVFNDGNIIDNFDVRLWVHVSQEFDVAKLVGKLFEAIAGQKSEYPLDEMSKTISDKLTGKRYLLVLDDVWTKDQILWDQFKVHLKSGRSGNAILLTTRSSDVAGTVRSTYQFILPFLSRGDSWQLFQQSLGMPAKHLESEFVEVGEEIVKKCGGVPLAIKLIAGVLRGKELIGEWQAMRDSNLLDVESEEASVSVSRCLRLSYFHLPSHMKQCFTICSVFPKGHVIDKEQLIDQWIAHDMIIPEAGVEYLEYIGHKYFTSLVQMYFLQDVAENRHGRVECRMHDLVHDLCLSILDDKISHVVPKEETGSSNSCRYFSLTEEPEYLASKNIFRNARAVYIDTYTGDTYANALKHAKHLRSVTVGYVNAKEVNTISQVKYLKYLSLQCYDMLPEGISDARSLQALHIADINSALVEIPKSIGKLKKLRTLNLSGCEQLKHLPDSLGDCQMISRIDLSNCEKLTTLPNSIGRNEMLRELRLGNTKVERLPSSITKLGNLECLDLQDCRELVELPEGIGNLEKLQVLNLEGCYKLGGMPVSIGQLSKLKKLVRFVVGKGEKFAGISELAKLSRIGEELIIKGISHVRNLNDAHEARLKQKTALQKLHLWWMADDTTEVNTKLEQAVLDRLEPPPEVKELVIDDYSGTQYARWMQNHVGGGVQGPSPFPFLSEMRLRDLPNLKNLHGLVKLPCLERLYLEEMPCLESISGGPFPSLVKLGMYNLPCLEEVCLWTMPDGEEGGGCRNFTSQLRQFRVGDCLTLLDIYGCPKMEVKPHLPLSLQELRLYNFNEKLLQDLSIEFSLRSLQLLEIDLCKALHQLPECLGELCSLRELKIIDLPELTCLPESIGRLSTSLQSLSIRDCPGLTSLPEGIEGLASLKNFSITICPGLTSLPQGIKGLVSLEKLYISACPGIKSLPKGIKGLSALKSLRIYGCPDLKRRCTRGMGEDWHLISHIPDDSGFFLLNATDDWGLYW